MVRAARYGDGWYASTTYVSDQVRRQIARYVQALRTEAPDRTPRIAANRLVLVADSEREADALGARYLGPVLRRYASNGSLGEAWRGDPADAEETYQRLFHDLCIVGSPAAVAQQLITYGGIGVTHLHARLMPDELPIEIALRSVDGLIEAARLAGFRTD